MSRKKVVLPVGDDVRRLTVAEYQDGKRYPVSLLTIVHEGDAPFAAFAKEEDAHLFSSAPGLLAALEAFFAECGSVDDCTLMGIADFLGEETITKMRAAIAKAKGEA